MEEVAGWAAGTILNFWGKKIVFPYWDSNTVQPAA
jgi:hypothetical protein